MRKPLQLGEGRPSAVPCEGAGVYTTCFLVGGVWGQLRAWASLGVGCGENAGCCVAGLPAAGTLEPLDMAGSNAQHGVSC